LAISKGNFCCRKPLCGKWVRILATAVQCTLVGRYTFSRHDSAGSPVEVAEVPPVPAGLENINGGDNFCVFALSLSILLKADRYFLHNTRSSSNN
jgi:hypothetical protein